MPAILTLIFGKTEVKELFTVWPDIIGGKEGVGLPKAAARRDFKFQPSVVTAGRRRIF